MSEFEKVTTGLGEECGVCVIRYEFDESEADDIQLVMTDGVSGGTTGHFHQAID